MRVGVERHLCEQRERELRRNRHFLGCGQCEVRHIELVGIGAFPRGKSHFGRPVQTAQLEGDRQGDVGGVGMLAERLGWMLTPPQDVLVVTSVMMSTLFALILVFICLYLLKMITDGPGDQAGGYCLKSVHFPVSFFTLFPFFLFSSFSCQPFADTPHGFFTVFVGAKGGQTEKSFATGAEAYAGRAHHVGFVEHLFEEAPGTDTIRRL